MINMPLRTATAGLLTVTFVLTTSSCGFLAGNPEPVPTYINTSTETFTCPGVPDSSVDQMINGEIEIQKSSSHQGHWLTGRLECRAYEKGKITGSYAVLAVFGKIPEPDWEPLDKVHAYRGSKEEPFTVVGVEGEGIITLTNNGGGAASFTCGDHYVVTSVFVGHDIVGDVRTNLINLATSMTPWVCQGQPIPGFPGNTSTTLTDLTTTPNSPTPTDSAATTTSSPSPGD